MHLFSAAPSLLNNSPYSNKLFSAQFLFGIRLRQCVLDVLVARFRDFDRHVDWENSCFDCGNQPLFALFKKSADHTNIVAGDTDFRSDFVIVVATAAQGADVLQQVYCSVLPSRAVLNKTHNQTVAFLGLNHNCWNFCLAELNECFDTALAANEVVVRRISVRLSWTNGDGTLEANLGNALYDLLKIAPVPESRILKTDLVNRNGPYCPHHLVFRLTHAAASWNAVRTAIE
jgi:hypothetical protein